MLTTRSVAGGGEQVEHLVRRRDPLGVAEDDGVLELVVVALGIDHAELVALLGQAARGSRSRASTCRCPRSRRSARPRRRRAAAPARRPRRADRDAGGARRLGSVPPPSPSRRSMISTTPAPRAPAVTTSARLLDRVERVGHRDRAPAQRQEGVVVLGVADADDVVRRQPQLLERRGEAARLVDAGRQHHDRALVEDDLPLEPELADRLEHHRLVRLPGGDDAAADRKRAPRRARAAPRRTGPAAPARSGAPRPCRAGRGARRSRRRPRRRGRARGRRALRSGSSRPVTRISLRPLALSRSSASRVDAADPAMLGEGAVIVGGEREEIHGGYASGVRASPIRSMPPRFPRSTRRSRVRRAFLRKPSVE